MISSIDPLVLAVIIFASRVCDVPGPLIAAVIMVESSFNLHALGDYDEEGKPHSYGLGQLNDRVTFAGWPQDSLLNWHFNIMLTADHLKQCLDAFPRNKKLAIAAYSQGIPRTAFKGYEPREDYVEKVLQFEEEFQKDWSRVGSQP